MTPGNPSLPPQERPLARGAGGPRPVEALERGRATATANAVRMVTIAARGIPLADLERLIAQARQAQADPGRELALASDLGIRSRAELADLVDVADTLLAFRRAIAELEARDA